MAKFIKRSERAKAENAETGKEPELSGMGETSETLRRGEKQTPSRGKEPKQRLRTARQTKPVEPQEQPSEPQEQPSEPQEQPVEPQEQPSEPKQQLVEPREQAWTDEDDLLEEEYLKRLIGEQSGDFEYKTKPTAAPMTVEQAEKGGMAAEDLPETDSDVIKYFDDPDVGARSAARRGVSYAGRDAEPVDPVPERDPAVEHRIRQVRHETTVPGGEPDAGKFSDAAEQTRKTPPVDGKTSEGASGETKKFIKPIQKKEKKSTEPTEPQTEAPPARPARQKKNRWSFVSSPPEEPVGSRYPEFSKPEDRAAILKFLAGEKRASLIKLAICAAATLFSVLFAVLPLLMQPEGDTRVLPLFGGNGLAYGVLMLVLFLVSVAPTALDFSGGIFSLAKRRATGETALLLTWAAVLIQNIVLLFYPDRIFVRCPMYNAAVSVLTLVLYLVRIVSVTRTAELFRMLSDSEDIRVIRPVTDAHRSERIGQGILEPNAKIAYRARTQFMDKLINTSLADDPTTGICTVLLPVTGGAALLTLAVVWIVSRDFSQAVSAFAAVLIATVPLPVLIALKGLLDDSNQKLARTGGAIPSYATAAAFADSDAVLLDASDLYGADSMRFPGAKTYNGYSLYDCLLSAAAVATAADCPLNGFFRSVLNGACDALPRVESVMYEERQGLAAWVENKKMLLGTRDMMLNHAVEVPPPEVEKIYTRDKEDNKIVYFAVEGKLAAFFVVTYLVRRRTEKEIAYLARHGYTILLRSTDPYINEQLTERHLRLPADTVKVLNSEAAEYYKLCRQETPQSLPAAVFAVGGIVPALKAMAGAVRLKRAWEITMPLAIAGAVLGFLVTAVMSIFSGAVSVPGYVLLLMHLLFTGIGSIACRSFSNKK